MLQSASSRLSERINWATVQFLLENAVFLLIGLQVKHVVQQARGGSMSDARLVGVCAAVLLAVIVARPVWVYPATYLPRLIPAVGRADPHAALAGADGHLLGRDARRGDAGGGVRAAGLASRRSPCCGWSAFVVVAGTLLIQGPTLPMLVRWLDLPRPDPLEDALQEAVALQHADRGRAGPARRGRRRVRAGVAPSPSCAAAASSGPTPRGSGWAGRSGSGRRRARPTAGCGWRCCGPSGRAC